jgi:hypothetical protein
VVGRLVNPLCCNATLPETFMYYVPLRLQSTSGSFLLVPQTAARSSAEPKLQPFTFFMFSWHRKYLKVNAKMEYSLRTGTENKDFLSQRHYQRCSAMLRDGMTVELDKSR